MNYLTNCPADNSVLIILEKDVKNRWRWGWLVEKSDAGVEHSTWCEKIDIAGSCFCIPCSRTINYGNGGKKCLLIHTRDRAHIQAVKDTKSSFRISHSGAASGNTDGTNRPMCLTDKVCEVKAVVCSFLAEHCLPFSLAPELLALLKRLSSDQKSREALDRCTPSRTAAAYSLTHGVAHSIKKDLEKKLKNKPFSLAVDEATNAANDKVVNVLIQYFCDQQEKVVNEHLGSKIVNIATAANIYSAVSAVLTDRGLSLNQVISCLMDNCNVMRGVQGGVEALIRQDHKHLLDISGDTVHMIHNAASQFCGVLEPRFVPLEKLASDIYYDLAESPKASSLFKEVQLLLGMKTCKNPKRPISNRFLQMQQVTDRLDELMDPLLVYYSAFLSLGEQKTVSPELEQILQRHGTSPESVERIKSILKEQRKQAKSTVNQERKERIVNHLFQKKCQTNIAIQLYRGILREFEGYVKLFQSEKPLAHKLHSEIFNLTKEFYSQFMQAEILPELDAKALSTARTDDVNLQLRDSLLGVGKFCFLPLKECRRDKKTNVWLPNFYSALRCAYEAAAKSLKKLPLTNSDLINLSCLDPGLQKSSHPLMKLAEKLPQAVPQEQLGALDGELKCYATDSHITHLDADETDPEFRLDCHWWSKVMKMTNSKGILKYPTLSLLVKGLLSIISGPLIEGSFNIMGDIVEEDRTSLTVENYEACAIIKQKLRATGQTAANMVVPKEMIASVLNSYQTYQSFLKTKADSSAGHEPKQTESSDKPRPTAGKEKPQSSGTAGKKEKMSDKPQPASCSRAGPFPDKPHPCAQPQSQSSECSRPKTACPGRERNELFRDLLHNLQKAAELGYCELREAAEKTVVCLEEFPVGLDPNLDAKDFFHDMQAVQLYPQDGPKLVPVSIYGDGNCLARAASLLSSGTEDFFDEMRARIVLELVLHEDFYLTDDNLSSTPNMTKCYAQYSDEYTMEVLTPEVIKQIYRKEVQAATKNGTYMGIWQLHAVASIIGTVIFSVYPEYGGHNVRCHFHRLLQPRIPAASTSRDAAAKQIPGIMWTRTDGKELPEAVWRPNHFVACLPGTLPPQRGPS